MENLQKKLLIVMGLFLFILLVYWIITSWRSQSQTNQISQTNPSSSSGSQKKDPAKQNLPQKKKEIKKIVEIQVLVGTTDANNGGDIWIMGPQGEVYKSRYQQIRKGDDKIIENIEFEKNFLGLFEKYKKNPKVEKIIVELKPKTENIWSHFLLNLNSFFEYYELQHIPDKEVSNSDT
ncbi:MAG: hypothetical protein D6785_01270, partial [Planctomycetota bacterium]